MCVQVHQDNPLACNLPKVKKASCPPEQNIAVAQSIVPTPTIVQLPVSNAPNEKAKVPQKPF